MIPSLKVSVKRTIPKQITMPKIQESLTDQEIMEMLDAKEVESHIPNSYLSNILQVQREGWGKSSMYKLKSSQQIYSIQASQNERLV